MTSNALVALLAITGLCALLTAIANGYRRLVSYLDEQRLIAEIADREYRAKIEAVLSPPSPAQPASLQPWTPAERFALGLDETDRFIAEADAILNPPPPRPALPSGPDDCGRCTWVETTALGEATPRYVLGQTCGQHGAVPGCPGWSGGAQSEGGWCAGLHPGPCTIRNRNFPLTS